MNAASPSIAWRAPSSSTRAAHRHARLLARPDVGRRGPRGETVSTPRASSSSRSISHAGARATARRCGAASISVDAAARRRSSARAARRRAARPPTSAAAPARSRASPTHSISSGRVDADVAPALQRPPPRQPRHGVGRERRLERSRTCGAALSASVRHSTNRCIAPWLAGQPKSVREICCRPMEAATAPDVDDPVSCLDRPPGADRRERPAAGRARRPRRAAHAARAESFPPGPAGLQRPPHDADRARPAADPARPPTSATDRCSRCASCTAAASACSGPRPTTTCSSPTRATSSGATAASAT